MRKTWRWTARSLVAANRTRSRFLPKPVAEGVSNVAENLGTPSDVLNNILQLRPKPAITNTVRFVINTTVGIGGIFDPATAMGIYADETDFGETLHVWGAREGAFLVVPFAGPTTERDLIGSVVDAITNPIGIAVDPPESYYLRGMKLAGQGCRQAALWRCCRLDPI